MPGFRIRRSGDGHLLFGGIFPDLRACVEAAVRDRVSLREADLRRANLTLANLDDADLRGADLRHANLTGANLSEARFDGTDFSDAALYGACLCFSSLRECRFEGSALGGADIAGADIGGCRFSGLSFLGLDYNLAGHMRGCVYSHFTRENAPMSRPPLVVRGLSSPVAGFDRHLMACGLLMPYENWLEPAKRDGALSDGGLAASALFHSYSPLFREICKKQLKVVDFTEISDVQTM